MRGALVEAALALSEILDAELYRLHFSAFGEYVEQRFGWERAHAYRLAAWGSLVRRLSPMGDSTPADLVRSGRVPISERQARELARVRSDGLLLQRVHDEVTKRRGGYRALTAAQLRERVDALLAPPEPEPEPEPEPVVETPKIPGLTGATEWPESLTDVLDAIKNADEDHWAWVADGAVLDPERVNELRDAVYGLLRLVDWASALSVSTRMDRIDRTPFVGPPRVRGGGCDLGERSAVVGRMRLLTDTLDGDGAAIEDGDRGGERPNDQMGAGWGNGLH